MSPALAALTSAQEPKKMKKRSAEESSPSSTTTTPTEGLTVSTKKTKSNPSSNETGAIKLPPTPVSPKKESVLVSGKTCAYCAATVTPMWRHGPGAYNTLCNSCGVRWRRGKILFTGALRHPLLKPLNSQSSSSTKVALPPPSLDSEESSISGTSSGPDEDEDAQSVTTASSSGSTVRQRRMIVSDSIQDKPVSSPRSPHRQRAPPVPKISTPVPDRVAIFSSLLVRLPPARIPLLVSTLVKGRPSLERNLNRGHSIQLDVRGLEDAQWQALLSLMAAA